MPYGCGVAGVVWRMWGGGWWGVAGVVWLCGVAGVVRLVWWWLVRRIGGSAVVGERCVVRALGVGGCGWLSGAPWAAGAAGRIACGNMP